MAYTITFAPKAEREFKKLDKAVQRQLQPKIEALAKSPRGHGVEKLSGEDELYRIRSGDYRIIFQIQDRALVVLLVKIGHRREIYR
jgi:mRNA interferase RelE/StbE